MTKEDRELMVESWLSSSNTYKYFSDHRDKGYIAPLAFEKWKKNTLKEWLQLPTEIGYYWQKHFVNEPEVVHVYEDEDGLYFNELNQYGEWKFSRDFYKYVWSGPIFHPFN